MAEKVNLKIPIYFEKIQDYQINDTRFTKVKIFVLHTGLNLNNSIFTKEAVEAAIPSIYNTAILGFIEENSDGNDDFSDHRQSLEIKDKEIKVVYKGHAYGVIPESCNPRWEDKVCNDGVTRTFLVVDGLLWNKFDCAKDIFDRDLYKDQSMELAENYSGSFDREGHFVFDKFYFDGCCALGNGVQPAMTGASIEVNFALNEIKTKLEQFNQYFNNQSSNDVDNIENSEEGGNTLPEEIKNEEVTENVVDDPVEQTQENPVEETTVDNTEVPVEDTTVEESTQEEVTTEMSCDNDKTIDDSKKTETTFSTTYKQKREILASALVNSIERDDNGKVVSEVSYWLSDFDDSYVYVEKYTWSKDGDESWENGRFSYTFDESALTAAISGEFEKMILTWLTIEENEKIQSERTEYERLVQFEQKVLEEKRTNEVQEVFDKFDDQLKDVEEYSKLKENHSAMSVEAIEEKCFSLVGKITTMFSAKKKTDTVVKLDFETQEDNSEDDGYGGILSSKYNN